MGFGEVGFGDMGFGEVGFGDVGFGKVGGDTKKFSFGLRSNLFEFI